MWLLPALSRVSGVVGRVYYRLTIAGGRVPPRGPVLLVSNHPNSLFDAAIVAAASKRPVRFLAKAPLFTDPAVGWLVRGSGAVPIHRAADDPAQVGRNRDTFREVRAALGRGAAVAIFPEGVSHSEPGLVPLKTGAARIALGAAAERGAAFPVIPVGLTFRRKERFRSEALVLVGEPVAWEDLAASGEGNAPAVREMTRRLEAGLREVTVNLEHWEDAPLLEWAEEIYAAERGGDADPAARIRRLADAGAVLARMREEPGADHAALERRIRAHARVLDALRLRPADLHASRRPTGAVRWTLRQLAFFLLAAPIALVGIVVFWVPYRLTGMMEARARPLHDVRATYRALAGSALFIAWTLLLATGAAWLGGWAALLLLVAALPLGLLTVSVRDRWGDALADARRFLVLQLRGRLGERLRARQRELAAQLDALRERTLR